MKGQLRDRSINMNSVCARVYTEIMLCVHFVHVLGSTNFHTKEEAISLT